MIRTLETIGRAIIPRPVRHRLVRLTRWPPVGHVAFNNLRRTEPVSRAFGGDRGLPIDRYYIEKFLGQHKTDIHGHVLEIGDNKYTRQFGDQRVRYSDILYAKAGHPQATIIADLADAPHLSDDQFDCIICVQTLQFIPDMLSAIGTIHRSLKPEGVLLVTGSTAAPIDVNEAELWGEFWRFTTSGLHWLLSQVFAPGELTVSGYGNVLTAVAFMHGLATEELRSSELDHEDPQYEILVTARAVKRGTTLERS